MSATGRASSRSTRRRTVPVETSPPSIQPVKASTSVASRRAGRCEKRSRSLGSAVMGRGSAFVSVTAPRLPSPTAAPRGLAEYLLPALCRTQALEQVFQLRKVVEPIDPVRRLVVGWAEGIVTHQAQDLPRLGHRAALHAL